MPDAASLPRPRGAVGSPPRGKIGVLVEEHFDATEFLAFNRFFPRHGLTVEYLSRLWGQSSLSFWSNAEGGMAAERVTVTTDVSAVAPRDYLGLIAIGGYAMDRLRYQESIPGKPSPAADFLRTALVTPGLTIGAVCHGLWLLCAVPRSLRGRRVTCAHNIVCDVENAGATVVRSGASTADVVVDRNLVTARHPDVVEDFMATFVREITLNQAHRTAAAHAR